MVSVLYKPLCTLDMNPRGAAKWANCAQIHALCTGNKVLMTQKFDLSTMCTTQSHVLYSPWNTCRAVLPALWCRLLFTLYPWQKEKQNTVNMTFSLDQWIMHKKETFPDTKVWFVQNVHKSVSCTVVSIKYLQSCSSCTLVSPLAHHISLLENKNIKH